MTPSGAATTPSVRSRAGALVIAAVLLVVAVLGVQVANGGGDYTPLRLADPCVARPVTSVSKGIDGLTERLVLLGLDGAACRLHTSREALLLQLARPGPHTAAQVSALRAGLLGAVERMKADGTLPRSSGLANEALDRSDLNGFLKAALRALPDSLIDKNLKTDDVLRRAINKLDLRAVLNNLNDPAQLNKRVNKAVTSAVKDALLARLRNLI